MIATHDAQALEPAEAADEPQGLPYGPARTALDLAVRRLDEAELSREPSAMCDALADIARCYRSLGAFAASMDFMEQALRWSYAIGGVDQRVNLLCELAELSCEAAEVARQRDDERQARVAREFARDMAFEATRVATRSTDPHWEVKILLRASDVLDRCGDHDDAITMQTRAMTLMSSHPEVLDAWAEAQAGGSGISRRLN
ncbi:MAG: hypothetical protein HS128_23260 [Ideonella sp.]|nr:hypothetical protein [Ideonella sp.]MCC7457231.1 hypothetical protein [Nitrospira sp.]